MSDDSEWVAKPRQISEQLTRVSKYFADALFKFQIEERPSRLGKMASGRAFASEKLKIPVGSWSNWVSGRQMPEIERIEFLTQHFPEYFGDELYALCGHRMPIPEDDDIKKAVETMKRTEKATRGRVVGTLALLSHMTPGDVQKVDEFILHLQEENRAAKERADQRKMQAAAQKRGGKPGGTKMDDFDREEMRNNGTESGDIDPGMPGKSALA